MKKLFMISLGGKAEKANIEVHDVQFAVGETIEEVIDCVKAAWYGRDFKLHMDSYLEVKGIPGWQITLTEAEQRSDQRLYFAFLGGYMPSSTQEVHDVRLLVARSEKQAKVNAVVGFDVTQPHVDNVADVEKVLLSADGTDYYIELAPSNETYDLSPDWFGYRRLDQ